MGLFARVRLLSTQVKIAEQYLEVKLLVFWYGSATPLFIIMQVFV